MIPSGFEVFSVFLKDSLTFRGPNTYIYVLPWISVVSEKIKEKISSLKSKQSFQKHSPVLSSNTCVKALAELHENFVIVPIDKAANNIALVCKRFYAQVLVAELGLDGINTCPTYEKVDLQMN